MLCLSQYNITFDVNNMTKSIGGEEGSLAQHQNDAINCYT